MSKVFRLHNIQGSNEIKGWQPSTHYGTTQIGQIEDPDGATAQKEITSIPSPFARIDLIKTAFKEVVYRANKPRDDKEYAPLDGDTIYHKMVSDTLDVAEIFFNINRLRNQFEILVWDRQTDLDENNALGKTLGLFMEADKEAYNFDLMERVYILNYIGKYRKSRYDIVGATSPSTMFFSSANDLSYIEDVSFGSDRPFDGEYNPLYKRDFAFQKYLYTFRKSMGLAEFARRFPELNAYMNDNPGNSKNSFSYLSANEKNIIVNLNPSDISRDYEEINVDESGANKVRVLGYSFHQPLSGQVTWQSDFEIKSNIAHEKQPLVLPIQKGDAYTRLRYTTANWESSYQAPICPDGLWTNRKLPIVEYDYPYLTIGDFLTDTIMRMPNKIDNNNFFDGNLLRAKEYSYLLPLKEVFFDFFTEKDLMEGINNRNGETKKMIEIEEKPDSATVILRIPIKKENTYIEYRRTYYEAGVDIADIAKTNDGKIIDVNIGIGVMPLVKFPENVTPNYRIAMFDKCKQDTTLTFESGKATVDSKRVIRAKKDLNGHGCSHESYIVEKNFDRIMVTVGDSAAGYALPRFKEPARGTTFTFAVDFGTTNTHIEYATSVTSTPRAFEILPKERQLKKMHENYDAADIRMGFVQEFIPDEIRENSDYTFPMRTVFSQRRDIDYDKQPQPLADGSIPFQYEKELMPLWNDIKTELKWGGVHDRLLEMHLETLFILMRNKVILNDGNLAETKVIWFYPASMTEAKVTKFKKLWKDSYTRYFGPEERNVISISESMAPFSHFVYRKGAGVNVVTIDVGGGTTDVLVAENEEPKMLQSFRFASNAIFGDGYNSNPSQNGFVRTYKDEYINILQSNDLQELIQALNQIIEQDKSSDIVAFLFSLVGNKVKGNTQLNFLNRLKKNDNLRYVFIVFYASIIYFVAKTMKEEGLAKPQTICFSGNGSRTLEIISEEESILNKFAKLIFDGIYGDESGVITVMKEANPKVATCKGGIERPKEQDYDSIDNIKKIFVCPGDNAKLAYKDIHDDTKQEVIKSVIEFFDFLFNLHESTKEFLCNKLGAEIGIYKQVKDFCTGEEGLQIMKISLDRGLKFKETIDQVTPETKLEETLFFYPLVGILHDLAYKISQK